jgi:hemoglobin
MKRHALIFLAAICFATPAIAKDSLYTRLGGYDGIAAVTDAFVGKLTRDASLGRFLKGHSTSSVKRLRQHVIDFLCENSGGPCVYTGRTMLEAHTGLNITEADWTGSVKLLTGAMTGLKADPALQEEVLKVVGTLKPDIVGH